MKPQIVFRPADGRKLEVVWSLKDSEALPVKKPPRAAEQERENNNYWWKG